MRIPLAIANLGAKSLTLLNPEQAHNLTINMLEKAGPVAQDVVDPILSVKLAGLSFANPLGLAAGFDKNARVANQLLDLGFGFVEVGAVTPKAQPGNPQPRIFRLRHDQAVINRYGFNNDGLDVIRTRLQNRVRRGIVGINLGANKDSEDRTADYVTGLEGLAGLVDFYTVNISSPNTPGLRALQGPAALEDLLRKVLTRRNDIAPAAPVFLKLAPDLSDSDKTDITHVISTLKGNSLPLDGLVISNTTLARPDSLTSAHRGEAGGLSGAPLFESSTRLLGEFYQSLGGAIPLIGVGGVASARDTYRKILHGAHLVQLYTALAYQGPGLVSQIIRDLPAFLHSDGFETIDQAVGAQFR